MIGAPENGRNKRNKNIIPALSIAAGAVNFAKAVAPDDGTKGTLSALSGILSIIKKTIKNKKDFCSLIQQCDWIAKLIESVHRDQMTPALSEALNTLDCTVRMVRGRVVKLRERKVYKRVIMSTIDVENIKVMTTQLDRSLTELMIVSQFSITWELKTQMQAIESFSTKNEALRTTHTPPPRPAIFCGRDHLVRLVSDNLLSASRSEMRHVALIGVGGIGKSSIARAVLNEPKIERHFAGRRFFVRFDDIPSSQITYTTFINRVAHALGIAIGSDHGPILDNIKRQTTLLVLDNGETFLDTKASRDVSRIRTSIDEIGGLPSVAILLTSRNRELPCGLMWEKVEVPSLDPAPAFDVFMKIFRRDISHSHTTLKGILAAADHHPLTITLLAHAAETNSWTIDDLNERWVARPAKLLNTGYGKYENLADSIEISLASPRVAAFGENVRRVFQTIAFFPQGIQRSRLTAMFPSIEEITDIVEVLHKQSLVFFIGNFVSMLAPVRLYARHAIPIPDTLVLNDIRTYYHRLIYASAITDDESVVKNDNTLKSLMLSEDINIEALISFDLQLRSDDIDMMMTLKACEAFIWCLYFHNPRSTPLRTVLLRSYCRDEATSVIRSAHLRCFKALGFLTHARNDIRECIEICIIVQDIATTTGRYDDAIQATLFLAGYHLAFGACRKVQEALDSAQGMPGWGTTTILNQALFYGIMGHLKEFTDPDMTEATITHTYYHKAFRHFQVVSSQINQDVRHGRHLFFLASALIRSGHQEASAAHTQSKDANLIGDSKCGTQSTGLVMLLAIAAFVKQDIEAAKRLFQRAWVLKVEQRFFAYAAENLLLLAVVAIAEGKPNEARDLIKRAEEQHRDPRSFSDRTRWYHLYISGAVELASGRLSGALTIFEETKKFCESRREFHHRALSSRAIGEIAHLQGDFVKSNTSFKETVSICDEAGISPCLLYGDYVACIYARIPPASYEAWPLFLKNTARTIQ